MDRSLSFFRVFDLAMFLPGLILLWLLAQSSALGVIVSFAKETEVATVAGVIELVTVIALTYGLGLLVHSLQRSSMTWLLKKVGLLERSEATSSWCTRLADGPAAELATYFWYMRATCLNLSLALLIAAVALTIGHPVIGDASGPVPRVAVISAVAAALLLMAQGRSYDQALHKAVGRAPVVPGAGPSPSG